MCAYYTFTLTACITEANGPQIERFQGGTGERAGAVPSPGGPAGGGQGICTAVPHSGLRDVSSQGRGLEVQDRQLDNWNEPLLEMSRWSEPTDSCTIITSNNYLVTTC